MDSFSGSMPGKDLLNKSVCLSVYICVQGRVRLLASCHMISSTGNDFNTVVCDVGAYQFRAGLAGQSDPVVFPTSTGYILEDVSNDGPSTSGGVGSPLRNAKRKHTFVGNGVLQQNSEMIIRPVFSSSGLVDNWGGYEELWNYFFESRGIGHLSLMEGGTALLVTEQPTVPPKDRERVCELLFEKFQVPLLSLVKTPVLGTFANARTSAVAVDMGHSVITSTVVQDGFFLRNSVQKSEFAGDRMNAHMKDALARLGASCLPEYLLNEEYTEDAFHETYTRYHKLDLARRVKENVCYVSPTPLSETFSAIPATPYTLPDGTSIPLGAPRVEIPEMIFEPPYGGQYSRVEPLNKLVYNALRTQVNNPEFQRDMWGNIIVMGGSSTFVGTAERLTVELAPLTPKSISVNVIAPKLHDRSKCAWLGGSILGTLQYEDLAMTKGEYAEHGAHFIAQRCP